MRDDPLHGLLCPTVVRRWRVGGAGPSRPGVLSDAVADGGHPFEPKEPGSAGQDGLLEGAARRTEVTGSQPQTWPIETWYRAESRSRERGSCSSSKRS